MVEKSDLLEMNWRENGYSIFKHSGGVLCTFVRGKYKDA